MARHARFLHPEKRARYQLHLLTVVLLLMYFVAGTTFSGARVMFPNNSGRIIDVTQYGADGTDEKDDTEAIQAALDHLEANKGGTVYLPPGDYLTSRTIYIRGPRWVGASLIGAGKQVTSITYTGGKFVNVIEALPDAYGGVRLTDLTVKGGPSDSGDGAARYCFYAAEFHRGCEITRCTFRNAFGLIRIERGFFSKMHNNDFRDTVTNRDDSSISHAQWLEVHGPESAPVYLKTLGACNLNNNSFFRIGSESKGVLTHVAVWLNHGTGTFNEIDLERCDKPGVQTLLRLDDWGGTAKGWHVEWDKATRAVIEVNGSKPLAISDCVFYAQACETFLLNNSWAAVRVQDSSFESLFAGSLFSSANGKNSNAGTFFENCTVRQGKRVTNADFSDEEANILDTHKGILGFSYPLGVPDTPQGPPQTAQRTVFPRRIEGYRTSVGTDRNGIYVQVTGGRFRREDGSIVYTPYPVRRRALRLRPGKPGWYRLYVGEAGQAYLVNCEKRPESPCGNWLAEIHLPADGSTATVTDNPRLGMPGRYVEYSTNCETWLPSVPKRGYWHAGDRVFNAAPTVGAPAEWVCVKTGYATENAVFEPVAFVKSTAQP